jgi:single-strand DNA-binding protein
MRGVNKVILVGNLTQNVEVRYTQAGKAVGNTSIACNETWTDKNGHKQEKVEFIGLVFWDKLAEIAGEYLAKGSPIYVEGQFKTEKWEDKNGSTHYTTKVHVKEMNMLPNGRDSGGHSNGNSPRRPQNNQATQQRRQSNQAPTTPPASFDDFDDEIPF